MNTVPLISGSFVVGYLGHLPNALIPRTHYVSRSLAGCTCSFFLQFFPTRVSLLLRVEFVRLVLEIGRKGQNIEACTQVLKIIVVYHLSSRTGLAVFLRNTAHWVGRNSRGGMIRIWSLEWRMQE